MNEILKKILELIERKKISRNQFCIECGINRNAINNWENRNSKPKTDDLKKIADYFNIPISYFYEDNISEEIKEKSIIELADQIGFTAMTEKEKQEFLQHAKVIADGIKSKRNQ